MAVDFSPDSPNPFSDPRVVFQLPSGLSAGPGRTWDVLPNGDFLFAIAPQEQRFRIITDWLEVVDGLLEDVTPGA